jgi:hypothetical protein
MKKVFQTNTTKGEGNCMQAVMASLFEEELDAVPNFITFGENWGDVWYSYLESKNINMDPINLIDIRLEVILQLMKHDGGIGGYFYAVVNSRTNEGVTHAVIVDSNCKVVHDPNPNQRCLGLTPEDILMIYGTKGDYHFDFEGNLVVNT